MMAAPLGSVTLPEMLPPTPARVETAVVRKKSARTVKLGRRFMLALVVIHYQLEERE
jgi:hypothetical protein